MERRYFVNLQEIYTTLITIWTFLMVVSYGTTISESLFVVINTMLIVLWLIFRLFVLLKLAVEFSKSDWIYIVLLILAQLTTFFSENPWAAECIWILCGTKHLNITKVIKKIFIAQLIGCFLIIFAATWGIIEDYIILKENAVRHSLGFNHPNALSIRIMNLCFMWALLKRKLEFKDSMLLIGLAIILYKITYSISASILLFIFAIMILLYKCCSLRGNKLRNIVLFWIYKLKSLFIIMPFFATVVILKVQSLQKYFSGTLGSRISQAIIYFKTYGLTWFGVKMESNNSIENFYLEISPLYTLDNGYMNLLLGYGVLCFACFILGEIILSKKVLKEKNYILYFILIIYLIDGFVETAMIRFTYNFSILYLGAVVSKTVEIKDNGQKKICFRF